MRSHRTFLRGSRICCCPLLLIPTFLITCVAFAQTVTGNITGTVTDSSGAVVVGATVTAHNVATGVDTPVTTNDAGLYIIRFLPIGQYQVTVEANGFGKQILPTFSLEIDQTAKFNVQLQAGAAEQTVEVSAATAPILNTNDASLGVSFTANEISNVPLNGLNFSSLTLFVPGSVSTNAASGTAGNNAIERNTFYSGVSNINGNRAQANNYTLDGIDMNENQNNLIAYNPAPNAIQEIKVISANAPAEYGNVNGGDVLSVLKSGTNQLHGSAYGYLQNENMNANSWQNNHSNIPINPFTQTQFGGTLGGPIIRNKLFFFIDYIGARMHKGGTATSSVFTQAMRGGDFSVLLNPPTGQNSPVQLYDTQNNFAPYVNNQISVVSPVAAFIFAHPELYPLPNATPTDGVAANNYHGPNRAFTVNNQGDVKIEWDPRVADKITGFYGQSDAYDGSEPVLILSFPPQNFFPTKIGGATWVHVFSPAIVNAARIGFTRVVWNQGVPTDPSGQFGLTGNAKVGIPFGAQQYSGFSFQNLSNFSGVGTPANIGSIIDNTFSYIDNLSWQHGNHLFSMGIQAIRYQNNYITSSNQGFLGSFNYSGVFTSNPNTGAVNGLGYAGADFVLDRVYTANVQQQGVLVGNRQWRAAGFFQDDWKILPTLTLNLGIRYEFDQPWYEVNNKTGNVLLNNGTVIYASRIPAGAPTGAQLCQNRACYDPNYTQIMPRIGFAYQAKERLVIRAGYGATSFFEGNSANQRLTSIPPFIQSSFKTAIVPSAGNGGQPDTIEEGFSSNPANINYSGQGFSAWPQNMRPAYIQEWSLTTEYALTPTTSLSVGYLGQTGQHLIDYRNGNQLLVPGDFSTAPLANVGAGSPEGAIGPGGSLLVTESRAMMNYNALQTTLRQRLNHGLEYTVNYTYGRAMTNALGNYTLNAAGYNTFASGFQNGYDSGADYGPAGYDVRHNLSAVAVYELPFGHGREFGSGVSHWLDQLIGGWSLSGTAIAYSGFPATIIAPIVANANTSGFTTGRPNQYRSMHIVHSTIQNWFGTDPSATPCASGGNNGVCAYALPAGNTFGNTRVGTERSPNFKQIDSALFKDFHITERHAIGFRADAFNVFNIASYGNPDTNITDSAFGNIADQGTPVRSIQRTLQLSLHYTF
ncbi:MAG TPA: TonB-dependent receptor, partial [Pseudacidobacterium sp.]|nr:TonB-dependent receptor [Pseudacidobacterium sp.]